MVFVLSWTRSLPRLGFIEIRVACFTTIRRNLERFEGRKCFLFFSFLRKRKLWFRFFVVLRGVRKILLCFVKERFKKVVLERKFETSCSFNYGTSFTELDDRISDEKLNDQSSRYPTLKLNVIGVDFIFPCCSPSY